MVHPNAKSRPEGFAIGDNLGVPLLKRIRKVELEVGMFLVSYGSGTPANPCIQVDRPVLTPGCVNKLIPADVDDVIIDENLTIELLNRLHREKVRLGQLGTTPPQVPLAEELPVAEHLYTEALGCAHDVFDNVRMGRDMDYRVALPVVDGFIESVFRNEAAAATLFKLRRVDEYSYTHSIHVGVLAIILGKYLGLNKDALRLLGLCGMFHDVGKARIPEEILTKPARLTPQETTIIKTHPVESYKIISSTAGSNALVLRGALDHHERHDGSGYPRGITGDKISEFGRIVSIVDVYDALTSRRVYKDAIPASKALGLMYQWRDSTFSPNSIEHFIKCIGVYPVGSFVRLTNGSYALVAEINEANAARPTVKVVFDAHMRRKKATVLNLLTQTGQPGLEIAECLNAAAYDIDMTQLLLL